MSIIHPVYDYRLIAFSFLIAIFTSYTALDLAGRVTANRGGARVAWLAGGGSAMGTGIWCMHYTGMLAFQLPVPVYYHVPTVVLSLLAAILASSIALYVVSRDRMGWPQVLVGSLLMGVSIAAMHYIGMAAMRLQAMHHYDPRIWALSVLLAVTISFVGLLLLFYSRDENRGWLLKCGIALVIGLAIPVMHYTGMAAVTFQPMAMPPDLSHAIDISTLGSGAILIGTCVILGFALLTSIVDRRVSAQYSILENERMMLRALIDNIPDFMYVKDTSSRFIVANPRLARWIGMDTPEDLIGKTDFDLFPAVLATAFYEDEQEVVRSGQPLFNREETTVSSDGQEISILTTKVPLRNSKGLVTGIAGVGRDISDRKKNEDALREAEQRYRGIFDQAIFGIFQMSLEGRYLSVNPAMARTLGYDSPEDLMNSGGLSHEFFVDPKCLVEFLSVMETKGSVQNFECEVYRKDHSTIWLSSSVRAIYENGKVVRHEGMNEDITERKLLQGQLMQAQKLESVGQLAAGIAHEINTPTQYIGDNVRFLKDTFNDLAILVRLYETLRIAESAGAVTPYLIDEVADAVERADLEYVLEEIPKAIDQSLDGIGRVAALVSAMKEFSHPGTKEKISLDLNHAIQSTITVARNEWKYVAEMETDFDSSLPLVPCQPGEFNQVILNLIVNAAHAIAETAAGNGTEKGKIRIQTRNHTESAEIRIQDTGPGIPEKIRQRIFDPFFTTKEIGKGTGQGLAIARSVIVDKHSGRLSFETEEGVGTTFIIHLPYDGRVLTTKTEIR